MVPLISDPLETSMWDGGGRRCTGRTRDDLDSLRFENAPSLEHSPWFETGSLYRWQYPALRSWSSFRSRRYARTRLRDRRPSRKDSCRQIEDPPPAHAASSPFLRECFPFTATTISTSSGARFGVVLVHHGFHFMALSFLLIALLFICLLFIGCERYTSLIVSAGTFLAGAGILFS